MTDATGKLIVISGPSGVGKGTICKLLLEKHPKRLVCSISATTRPPRAGEIDGVNYVFLSVAEFVQRIENDEFLEWAKVYDNYYGTLKSQVDSRLASGINVILEIDTVGGANVKAKLPQAISIFLLPPDEEELKRRLIGRATDSQDVIEKRLACLEKELKDGASYDYQVVNDDLDQAVAEIEKIISL
jgi:guanylate kinase